MLLKFDKIFIYYTYLVFTVIIIPLSNDKWQYIPMLGIMYISPILLLKNIMFLERSFILFLGIGLCLFSSRFFHPEHFRISTILYSCMFMLTFAYIATALKKTKVNLKTMIWLFSTIIKAYAVVLIIQQISAIIGIPIINAAYGIGYQDSVLKQNSLSIEPSNTGTIVTILYYAVVKIIEYKIRKKITIKSLYKFDKILFISYSYVCLSSFSVACVFSYIVFLLYFLRFRNVINGVFAFLGISILLSIISPSLFYRITSLFDAISTLDPFRIYEIDSSSSARIAPLLVYLSEINLFNPNFWIGYGCDYGGIHVITTLSGYEQETDMGMGGIINLIYDYGIITFFLYFAFVIKNCGFKTFDLFMYIALIFIIPFNHYITWLFFMVIFMIRHLNLIDSQSKKTRIIFKLRQIIRRRAKKVSIHPTPL